MRAAHVGDHHHIAAPHVEIEIAHFQHAAVELVSGETLGHHLLALLGALVGAHREQHREFSGRVGAVDVGHDADALAHRHAHIALDGDAVLPLRGLPLLGIHRELRCLNA